MTEHDLTVALLWHGLAAMRIAQEWDVLQRDLASTTANIPQSALTAWLRHTTAVVSIRERIKHETPPLV